VTGFSASLELLRATAGRDEPAIVARVAATRGSAPREGDAWMTIARDRAAGTIGGGQLEWLAIEHARKILSGAASPGRISVALGPEIGQCCGGRVELDFRMADSLLLGDLEKEAAAALSRLPHVLIFGAGHTGKALARAISPLPVRASLIDERPDQLAGLPGTVRPVASALPESEVASAPPASAFVAMTHLHSLDFQIVAAALLRGDAAYCGMIGSSTKRAVFESWFAEQGHDRALAAKLTGPIGGTSVRDKRPEVIAAMTAAEILAALYEGASSQGSG
jgi:xanthine dehydrogenase accessory factor